MKCTPVPTSYSGPFAVADLNGDGKLDLGVASLDQSSVVILLGNGDGTFRPGVSYATAQSPESVAVADYNGDGKLDLAVFSGYTPFGVNLTSSISILLGNGDGTFQPFTSHGLGGYGVGAAGDFNNDGMMDLAAGDSTSKSTAILLQDNGTSVSVSPSSLVFATQLVSTVSNAQTVTLTNSGTSALAITKGARKSTT